MKPGEHRGSRETITTSLEAQYIFQKSLIITPGKTTDVRAKDGNQADDVNHTACVGR